MKLNINPQPHALHEFLFPWQLTAPACQPHVVKEAGFSSTMGRGLVGRCSGATLKPVVRGETLLCSPDWSSTGGTDGDTGQEHAQQVTGRIRGGGCLWRVLTATLKGRPRLLLGEKDRGGSWQTRERSVSRVCTSGGQILNLPHAQSGRICREHGCRGEREREGGLLQGFWPE